MSEDVIFVRPMSGCMVRDPDSMELLPESGAWVPRNVYWIRRLHFGDVTDAAEISDETLQEPAPSAESKKPTAPAKPSAHDNREENA